MNAKSLIWIGAVVGGFIGQFLPMLWGDNALSFSSIILSTIGGVAGIWAGFRLSQMV